MLKRTLVTFGTVLVLATAGAAFADTPWQEHHPRRDEVNDRLVHQDRRIDREVHEGEVTRARAGKLHRQDHRVRKEERLMASRNGGHITKVEQKALNQQENRISRRIGK